MSELAVLTWQRAALPQFPGTTIPEQLVAGRDAARAILLKYEPGFAYDADAAATLLRQIGAWEERNRAELSQIMAQPGVTEMPQAVQITFGADRAKAFILAGYAMAAAGMGPWNSGAVARHVEIAALSKRWADEDAIDRLNVFATIVKMEQDGYLAQLFGAQEAAGAFGIAPGVLVAIVVSVVALGALVLVYFYSVQRLEMSNQVMSKICDDAIKTGDQATITECLKAASEIQKAGMFPGLGEAVGKILGFAVIAGGAYLLLKTWKARKAA